MKKQEKTTIQPRNGLIMVRKYKETVSEGGIAFVKEAVLDHGIVLAAGPGEYQPDGTFKAVKVKPGDEVVCARGAGIVLNIDEEPILFITQQDIEAVIRQENINDD